MADYQMVLLRVHETASKFEGLAIFRKSFFYWDLRRSLRQRAYRNGPKWLYFCLFCGVLTSSLVVVGCAL
jgi:hypothetical protein